MPSLPEENRKHYSCNFQQDPYLCPMQNKIIPVDVILHKRSRSLEVQFNNGDQYDLPWEYLRVYSPSSEVRGRRGIDSILVRGKENVSVVDIKPVGNYALKLFFDDGHHSGLYDWKYLHELGTNYRQYWQQYRMRIATESAVESGS